MSNNSINENNMEQIDIIKDWPWDVLVMNPRINFLTYDVTPNSCHVCGLELQEIDKTQQIVTCEGIFCKKVAEEKMRVLHKTCLTALSYSDDVLKYIQH